MESTISSNTQYNTIFKTAHLYYIIKNNTAADGCWEYEDGAAT